MYICDLCLEFEYQLCSSAVYKQSKTMHVQENDDDMASSSTGQKASNVMLTAAFNSIGFFHADCLTMPTN